MKYHNEKTFYNLQNFLVILAIFLFFLGIYIGKTTGKTDEKERIAQIVSCEGYKEEFLKEMGYKDRNDCVDLNLALQKQYLDDCSNLIKLGDMKEFEYTKLLNSCVYHSFEKNSIFISSEYYQYIKKLKK